MTQYANTKFIQRSLAAVTWLIYCRYGVKLYPINQSINQLINQRSLEHEQSDPLCDSVNRGLTLVRLLWASLIIVDVEQLICLAICRADSPAACFMALVVTQPRLNHSIGLVNHESTQTLRQNHALLTDTQQTVSRLMNHSVGWMDGWMD